MRIVRPVVIAIAAVGALGLAGCHDFDLRCGPGAAACPVREPCPAAAPGTGCGDIPAMDGHDAIPIDGEVVVGCRAYLPYGAGALAADQRTCDCLTLGSDTPSWICPI